MALLSLESEIEEGALYETEELIRYGAGMGALAQTMSSYKKDLDQAMRELDEKVIKKHASKALKNAAKKISARESSSDTDSSTDEHRHVAYKGKDAKAKHNLRVFQPHLIVPVHMYTKNAMNKPQQTVDSVLKAAEQAKKQAAQMEEKGKELAEEVKKLREEFEKKDKEAKEAMVIAHAADDKAQGTKD
jgi:hypothetical protein